MMPKKIEIDDPRPRQEDPDAPTERARQRAEEDERFLPVVVKRTDEARRHPDDILQAAIDEGVEQLQRPPLSLFLSAIGAGLIVGFTAMAAAVVKTAFIGVEWPLLERIATALVYPLGFVVCLMSGTELFTEHTATAVYPVLDRRSGVGYLFRLWFLVGAGNALGTVAIAGLLTSADTVVGAREGYVSIGHELVGVQTLPLLASALLAGWLMALGAWLILATPPAVSQLVSIYIVTFLIGLGGLHHSIAGSAEMFTAYFLDGGFSLLEGLRFVGLAVVGNLIGGSLFVASLNYAHIRTTQ
ncbi:MAG: formate/nitrite transporter family protein [Acidobacteriota bacterium]|nr:formate/nitrite transporter family protein [Acidobacteriota bacterium]